MNFNQLRFVCHVAALKSFSAAAVSCSVTQPTLSNGIAQLEEELGHKIFNRTTRKVSLTLFGEHILPSLQQVLDAQENIFKNTKNYANASQPMVRIGISPLMDLNFLDTLLDPFRAQYPNTKMIFHELYMDDLYQMLDNHEIDFMFGVSEPQRSTRKTAFLYREPLQFIPKGPHQRITGNIVTFDEVAEETFVLVPDACGLTRTIRKLFYNNGRKLHEYPGEALSYQMLKEWTKRGFGATFLPYSKLQNDKLPHVDIQDPQGNEIQVTFDAVWNADSPNIGATGLFSSYLENPFPALSKRLA